MNLTNFFIGLVFLGFGFFNMIKYKPKGIRKFDLSYIADSKVFFGAVLALVVGLIVALNEMI